MPQKIIDKNEAIRVRMAPSPTGTLHVGTARTALFNYLFAQHYGGKFILRIEDTDTERSARHWEKDIIDGLSWLGLIWDEKPKKQSTRIKIYKKYLKKLLKEGKAFYCWHTKDELQKEKKHQMDARKAPRHICEYRNEKIKNRKKIKRSIIRFKNDSRGKVIFFDFIRGDIEFDAQNIGDFSIAKNLKTPLYNFAVVIDDYEMKISHIIRGEDHISNTPKQILLQEALEFFRPKYLHIPLILGSDKSKLSKRHGSISLLDYKDMGYLPEAIFNFLALLGWRGKNDEKEIMSKDEIIKEFSDKGIQKSPAIFDIEKLNWMNGEYIRKLSIDKLTELCLPYFRKAGFVNKKQEMSDRNRIKKIIALEQPRIKKISEIIEATEFFFKEPDYDASLLVWKNMPMWELQEILLNLNDIINNIEQKNWNKKDLENIIMPQAEMVGDRGKMLWPLRVAISGKKASPGPFEIMELLSKSEVRRRVKKAHQLIKKLRG